MFDLSDFSPWIGFKLGAWLEQGLGRMKILQMKMKHLFLDPADEFDYVKDNIVEVVKLEEKDQNDKKVT